MRVGSWMDRLLRTRDMAVEHVFDAPNNASQQQQQQQQQISHSLYRPVSQAAINMATKRCVHIVEKRRRLIEEINETKILKETTLKELVQRFDDRSLDTSTRCISCLKTTVEPFKMTETSMTFYCWCCECGLVNQSTDEQCSGCGEFKKEGSDVWHCICGDWNDEKLDKCYSCERRMPVETTTSFENTNNGARRCDTCRQNRCNICHNNKELHNCHAAMESRGRYGDFVGPDDAKYLKMAFLRLQIIYSVITSDNGNGDPQELFLRFLFDFSFVCGFMPMKASHVVIENARNSLRDGSTSASDLNGVLRIMVPKGSKGALPPLPRKRKSSSSFAVFFSSLITDGEIPYDLLFRAKGVIDKYRACPRRLSDARMLLNEFHRTGAHPFINAKIKELHRYIMDSEESNLDEVFF